MDISCAAIPCPVILNSTCVFYEGETLVYTGINSGDNLQTALQKIDAKFEDAGLGYVFVNGIIQTAPGVPVGLGGSLINDTTIGGNYRLTFAGSLESQAFVTTGGNSSQFVKGDGSLDNGSYQPSGNYISALTGDGTATGPGSAVFTLATVNTSIGTFGTSTTVPVVTVNGKGLITGITSTLIAVPSGVLIFTGDVTGSGMTGSPVTLTLLPINADVYGPNTFLKFAVNAKGLVTSATLVTAFDIMGALGYTPVPSTRTITINGVTRDLSANRTFSVGTVTNVSVSSGVGISASVADPTNAPIITITNTAPDRIVNINSGANINVTGVYPNFTITGTATSGGTVTSIGMTVPAGLTISGSPITTSGTLALGLDSGYSIPTISNQNTWTTAYDNSIVSAAVTGTSTKTLTLTQQDAGTITASWSDDGLTSVGLSMPSAFTVSSSPLTSNGTISVTGAGTISEYVRGDGSLATFPSLAGYVTNVTATSPILSSGGTTPDISIPAATTSVSGYLTSTDWNTFDGKQPQLNGTGFVKASGTTISYDNSTYLTNISGIAAGGELSGTYPNPTLLNSAVIGKVLTGLSVSGGSITATDDIVVAFGKVQNQINALVGGLIYQGTWNASTNTPALTSGVGTNGDFYIVSVAGTTNLDGNNNWHVGDWAVFHTPTWEIVDNTDSVTSVNGFIGAVVLSTTDIAEGTNLYYTDTRARNAISGGTGISYAPSTGIITNSAPDQTVILSNGTAISVTGTYPSFTIANTAPDQTVSLSNGTGISVSGSYPNFTITNTSPSSGGTVTGTGTTNTVPKFTSASSIGDSNIKDNGSAVTINATAGSFGALQVGNYNGSILMNTTNTSGGLIFQNTSSSNKLWDFSSYNNDINFNESGVPTPVMTLQAGGNIGVNTTIPTNKFEVNGTFKAVGVATFGSTLSNGTYTYTLPGATGTLALLGDLSGYVPTSRTLTINGVGYDLSADRSWTVTSMVYPSAGIAVSTGTAWGTSITDNSADWNTAYTNRITSLTTIGTSGPATLLSNVLNIPNYSTDLSGYVPYIGATTNLNLGSFNLISTDVTANGNTTLLGTLTGTKTVSSGSPYSLTVTQNNTNSSDTGDGALSVSHVLSGIGTGTELVTRSFIFGSDNQRTGGSVLSNSRVLYLVSSTQAGTNTTNLDQVYIEGGAMVGSVTNNRGVLVKTMQGTNQAAFVATGLTSSNRVHLLLGNYTLPTGAWGIYSGLSDASYLQGSLLLGSASDDTVNKLQVTGAAKLTGQLTLGSTITNGTYTYTLPSATGTLALTSDIPTVSGTTGYIPKFTGTTAIGNSALQDDGSGTLSYNAISSNNATLALNALTSSSSIVTFSQNGIKYFMVGSDATASFRINSYTGATFNGVALYVPTGTSRVLLGNNVTDNGVSSLQVLGGTYLNGTLQVTGIARFDSTLTNGTYTYTLPSATGTLALTSALSGYLPLTGGTLTGALGGTSASFTSSSFPLDIYGTTNNYGLRINNVQAATLFLYSSNANAASRNWGLFTNYNAYGDFTITQSNAINGDLTNGANGTSRFYISNAGNVGINTITDAGYKLDVNGTGRFSGTNGALVNITGSSAGSNTTYYTATNNTSNTMQLGIASSTYVNSSYPAIVSNGAYLYSPQTLGLIAESGYPIYLQTGGVNRLTIASTGAATFSSSLQAKSLSIIDNVNTDLYNYINNQSTGTSATARFDIGVNVGSYAITMIKYGLNYSGSLFGNSATNSSAIFDNSASSNGFSIGLTTTAPLIFGTSNSERMRITSGGNVLIGTTTDTGYKLNVNGSARIVGGAIVDRFITDSGTASCPYASYATFYTVASGQNAIYLVTLQLSGYTSYTAYATICQNDTVLVMMNQVNNNAGIQVSGLNIQGTNGSGITQSMVYKIIKIA